MKLTGAEVAAFEVGGLITRLTGDINQIQSADLIYIRVNGRAGF